jgi:hypothetical protein
MDVQYLIKVDAAGAIKEIQKFDDSLKLPGKTAPETGAKIRGLWKDVALGELAYDAAKKAGHFFWGELKDSIGAYMDAESGQRKLNTAIRMNGEDVEKAERRIDKFADTMKLLTGTDDDQVKVLERLARQYGIQTDKIDDTVKGVIGLTEMGGDLEGNLKAVANAYEGNWGQLERLIPELRSAKDETEKYDILNRKMGEGFRMATESMGTYTGQLRSMKLQYDDIKKSLGGALISGIVNVANAASNGYFAMRQASQQFVAQQQRTIDETHAHIKTLKLWHPELRKTAEDIDYLNDLEKDNKIITDTLNAVAKSRKKSLEDEGKAVAGTVKSLVKYVDLLEQMPGDQKKSNNALEDAIPIVDALGEEIDDTGMVLDGQQPKWVKFAVSVDEAVEKALAAWQKYGDAVFQVLDFIDAISQQTYKNEETRLDNEYKKRLEVIQNSKKSEEDKAKDIEKLDTEFEGKRQELARKRAEQEKKMAIMNATIAAIEAAAKTYTNFGGWPFGIVPAAIMLALGMALVSKIKAQPIPMAQGGIFNKPTLLGGGQYQVAEAGEKEVVAPLSGLKRELGLDRRGGQPIMLEAHITLNLEGKPLKQFIWRSVAEGSQLGVVKLKSKAVN